MPGSLKSASQIIQNQSFHKILIALAFLVVNGAIYSRLGIRILVDGHGFLDRADLLLSTGHLDQPASYFYFVYIGLIAFIKWTGLHPITGTIGVQVLLNALSVMALYKAFDRLFKQPVTSFITALIYILWWEHMQWNFVLMTESVFRSLSCFLLYFLALYSNNRKSLIGIIGILMLLLLTRPTAIILVLGVISFLTSLHWTWLRQKHLSVKLGFVTLVLLLGLWSANRMFGMWDFTQSFQTGNIITYMDVLEGNSLYDPDMRLTPPADLKYCQDCSTALAAAGYFYWNNLGYVIQLGVYKLWYLLSGFRPYYSILHNWVLGSWMLLIYATFLIGCLQVRRKEWIIFALTLLMVNCCVVVISGVDWDNRFYIPMESGIVVLAGFGAGKLIHERLNYISHSSNKT